MIIRRTATLVLAASVLGATELPREMQVVEERQVPVSSRAELTINARDDEAVASRELWFTSFDGKAWSEWRRHGVTFDRSTPITWAPAEGHWKIYVRITQISGLALPLPAEAKEGPFTEFIIDRTAPTVRILEPATGAKLRGGERASIRWEASDPHLHSSPITIRWSPGGDKDWTVVAEHIPNSGTFTWTIPQDMTPGGRLEITAADRAKPENVGRAENTGIVVDALPPMRNILGPAIVNARQVNLQIKVQDAGPAGVAKAQLWFSRDNGGTWTGGPEVTSGFSSMAWTAPADGTFLLALVATDQSGNINPIPKGANGAQASILVDTVAPVIALTSPFGVADAKASGEGSSRRIFKPGDQVVVRYRVNDGAPAARGVSVLLQAQTDARWEVLAKDLPIDAPYTFAIPDIQTKTARIKVQALDTAGNQGETISAETFSVDNKVDTGTVTIPGL